MKSSIPKLIPRKIIFNKAWVKGDNGRNWMLEMDGWHISYNPSISSLGSMFAGESEEETALCGDWGYYILNGDYRRQYEKLVDKGLDACIAFFKENINHISSWSDEPPKAAELRKLTSSQANAKPTRKLAQPNSKGIKG